MRAGVAAAIAIILATPAGAQECRAIQDAKDRLACYDRQNSNTAAPSPAVPSTKGAKQAVPADAPWQINKQRDKMTDKISCTLIPKGRPEIQFTVGDLYISYARRGGVQGFRYRIDSQPASEMQLPTNIERQIGVVRITGHPFDQLLTANRLVVSTLTLVGGIKEDEISLQGFRAVYDRMRRECAE